jgi:hypothetical protein
VYKKAFSTFNCKIWHRKTITTHNYFLQLYEQVFDLWFFFVIVCPNSCLWSAQYYLAMCGMWKSWLIAPRLFIQTTKYSVTYTQQFTKSHQAIKAVQDYDSYSVCIDYFDILWLQYNTVVVFNHIIIQQSFRFDVPFKLWTGSRSGELHPFSLSLPSISGPKLEIIKFSRLFWRRLQGKWTGLRHSCTLTLNRHSFGLYGFHQDYCTFSVMCCNRDQGLFELQLFMSSW